MSVAEQNARPLESDARPRKTEWNWHPDLPIENSPFFSWPPDPAKMFRWFAMSWLDLSVQMILVLFAVLVWFNLQPALELCRTLEIAWIAQIYVRNMVLMFVVAGSLHLYFCTFKKQGKTRKYDHREQARNSRTFTFRTQVWDNMLWTCASGVTFWTAYEVLFVWAYANQLVPYLAWSDNPVWFALLFVLIPVWSSFHFYWVHRWLHWKPLYRLAHSLHHRNVNVGPWSGLSMHPVEHVIYMSSVMIHWVVASHPIHVFFHMYWLTLGAATSHTGYEGVVVNDKNRLKLGFFFHQLHHRYFECNYGNADMPWDKWFGSFHDGTPEATEKIRERRRRMHGTA